ncbi:MAG: potassium channel protein [Cyanobacteria bacterium P01_A01_bin.40]
MHNSLIKVAIGTAFFILTIIVAVVGYIFFGWTTLEAVYMVVITIFGVGYGEVQPLETASEKIFTIFVILAGTSSALYIVGGFVQMVAEGEITRAFDAQRKQNTIANLENHVIICGFGRIAQVMAQQLAESSQIFLIIENDPQRIVLAEEQGFLVKAGDATDETTLEAVGIQQAQVLATVLPEDATNVFITLTARELNANLSIIARGELPSTEKKLRLAGANHVILPATVSGIQMANLITRPTSTDFLQQKDRQNSLNDLLAQIKVQIDELTLSVHSPLVGRTIRELEIRGKGAFIIVALRRENGELLSHPHSSLILNCQDTLIAIGHQEELPKFARYYQLNHSLHQRRSQERILN